MQKMIRTVIQTLRIVFGPSSRAPVMLVSSDVSTYPYNVF